MSRNLLAPNKNGTKYRATARTSIRLGVAERVINPNVAIQRISMRGVLRHVTLSWATAAAIIVPALSGCVDAHPTAPRAAPRPSAMVVCPGDPGDPWSNGLCNSGDGEGQGDSWSSDGSGGDCCSGAHVPDQYGQQDINDAKGDFSSGPFCTYVGTTINSLQAKGQIQFYSDPTDGHWGFTHHIIGMADDPNAVIYINTGQPAWGDSLSVTLIHEATHAHTGSIGDSSGEAGANEMEDLCGP